MVLMEEEQGKKERKAKILVRLMIARWQLRGVLWDRGCIHHNGVWRAQDTLISFESLINKFVNHQQY